ncbi:Thiol:disulfide interchange protein DsbD [Gammaproteobacteria bacterium]
MHFRLLAIVLILAGAEASASSSFFGRGEAGTPLAPEVAFPYSLEVLDATHLLARWETVPGHYLYRDKIQFRILESFVSLGSAVFPKGESKQEEDLGLVEVYRNPLEVTIPLSRFADKAVTVTVETKFQGCVEGRLCYPPISRSTQVALPKLEEVVASGPLPPVVSSRQDQVAKRLASGHQFGVLAWFFGVGLLLAFTPCVFPMVPILSSLIVGQGTRLTTARAFSLSLAYVLAMSVTYTVAGIVAGLAGANLQAAFQTPWILFSFSALFVTLALSMFGLYDIQIPSSLQIRLTNLSNRQTSGTWIGAAVMGVLSALVVGPCIAPPLAGALLYLSQTGDIFLSGLALFCMSMGMGAPLLVLGTTGGQWLPRAGAWMETIKSVFGVLLLGVALEMLGRVLPTSVSLPLWGVLFVVVGVYLGALDPLPAGASGWKSLWKGLGVVTVLQGSLILVGTAGGGEDLLQPLKRELVSSTKDLSFQIIHTSKELDQVLFTLKGKSILLDFRADWCVECKRMERSTFSDPSVREVLKKITLLQVDVTQNSLEDRTLLKRFGLIGPPALVFFSPDGAERINDRIIGFVDSDQLLSHLNAIIFKE